MLTILAGREYHHWRIHGTKKVDRIIFVRIVLVLGIKITQLQ